MAEQIGFALPAELGTRPPRDLLPEELRKMAKQKQRRCLHCSDTFASSGPGHRICSPCKSLEVFTSSPSSFSIHTAAF